MTNREFQSRLARRAVKAGVALPGDLGLKLEIYFRLLAKWNARINLTGLDLSEPTPDALDRLLIEPLVAARHVLTPSPRMVDIGSGGGSPAIPLALGVGGSHMLMVESKTRKSVFLREVVRELQMSADVATSRFEELLSRPELHEAHDFLSVRAVRVEARVLGNLQAFVRPGGTLLLFRNVTGADLGGALVPPLVLSGTHVLLESLQSRLVVLEKRDLGRRFG